eukprot:TRINITY_DN4964_c0_g1_i1.p1 TRINITY_DN4964_c0_g1~~TRINITY_DN4964_c0_g1_i1.p1  ORF type:complete len:309 (-),score=83.13 TRINITY_DN4964_c0_g1_i1:141-1067(-)
MPVDYSKFDKIEDSDEEPAPSKSTALAPARKADAARRSGERGRELLEPAGLDASLQMLGAPAKAGRGQGGGSYGGAKGSGRGGPADMEALEKQLEAWSTGGVFGGSGDSMSSSAAADAGASGADASGPQRIMARGDGRKKIHTTFPDGSEMVEEFDEKTDVLLLRKTRKSSTLGRGTEWVFEVGQAPEAAFDRHSDLMRASAANPVFLRKDTPEHLQWRIRNLAYPADVYSVTVDHEKQDIVVRTSNKKYFKRIAVPDVARAGLKLQDELLTWKHQHNTLIISYAKPPEVLAEEQRTLREAEKKAVKF